MENKKEPPLVVHVIYQLGIGGLENGLVNLINKTPKTRYRHAIICLKGVTDFQERIKRDDVEIYELHKREGNDFSVFIRLYKLLKKLNPAVVHTRNLTAIECQLPAFLAGVKYRVHGEHGWDSFDPDGSNRKYQTLRRLFRPLVQKYIPLSTHLECYLKDKIGVPAGKIRRICNGVDTTKFHPLEEGDGHPEAYPFLDNKLFVIGTVGRMHGVKDQITLVKAFIRLLEKRPEQRDRLRLVLIGEGPLRAEAIALLSSSGDEALAWLPREREDIDLILRRFDLFVLPSKAEGISNTILEAMASRLPVIATDTGGNPDLVVGGKTGMLVPCEDPEEMALALTCYVDDPRLIKEQGEQGLIRVMEQFSLNKMVEKYLSLYDELLGK
jgi:sugar transferase (PEP-CTERM/EpsH1 system associated)